MKKQISKSDLYDITRKSLKLAGGRNISESVVRKAVNKALNEYLDRELDDEEPYDEVLDNMRMIDEYYDEIFNAAFNGEQSEHFPEVSQRDMEKALGAMDEIQMALENIERGRGGEEDVFECKHAFKILGNILGLYEIADAARGCFHWIMDQGR